MKDDHSKAILRAAATQAGVEEAALAAQQANGDFGVWVAVENNKRRPATAEEHAAYCRLAARQLDPQPEMHVPGLGLCTLIE